MSGDRRKNPIVSQGFGWILRRLEKARLRIQPFLIVREGRYSPCPEDLGEFTFGFLDAEDVDLLVGFGPTKHRDVLYKWLQSGKRCYCAWDGPRLAAKMWCDFREFSYAPNFRELDDDEVYLFAAYVHPEYRGHGLAPLMRYKCYEALELMGRHKIYSCTEFFNWRARRFKQKLGAIDQRLGIHISLFGRWPHTWTLREYR